MCGIVGLINFSGKPVDAEALRDASQMLRLRGPDDSGVWAQGSVGFAHRRLSIIDLSDAGRQPMVDRSGRYVCVFNGEIYNFREIRQQLQADGVQFSSQSDTEILLESLVLLVMGIKNRLGLKKF